jgi:pentatricopeptide repeat protein
MKAKRCGPDVISYNTLIWGFCTHGNVEFGMKLIKKMLDKGCHPNVITYNILLKGYCQQGMLEGAISVWQQMVKIPEAEVVQDNRVSSIDNSALLTEIEVAELLLMEFLQGEHLKPNHITHTILINAYCRAGKLQEAFTLYEEMVRSGIMPDEITYSSLINGLCKAGKLINCLVLAYLDLPAVSGQVSHYVLEFVYLAAVVMFSS